MSLFSCYWKLSVEINVKKILGPTTYDERPAISHHCSSFPKSFSCGRENHEMITRHSCSHDANPLKATRTILSQSCSHDTNALKATWIIMRQSCSHDTNSLKPTRTIIRQSCSHDTNPLKATRTICRQ